MVTCVVIIYEHNECIKFTILQVILFSIQLLIKIFFKFNQFGFIIFCILYPLRSTTFVTSSTLNVIARLSSTNSHCDWQIISHPVTGDVRRDNKFLGVLACICAVGFTLYGSIDWYCVNPQRIGHIYTVSNHHNNQLVEI
eukprot:270731_1